MTNISSEESLGLAEETVDLQLTTASLSCNNRDNGSDEEVKARDQSPDGRFLKFEEIGRGSFKTVFKGLDTTTGVNLAWCELQERLNKKERERFREEVEMLKTLQHSNIVRFHDYWEVNTTKRKYLVLITELMTSGTLKTYLKKLKKINTKVLKSWCRQILKGLNFLHSRTPPVIHRDLKCDNIFITGTNGTVKIGDLGLATLKTKSFAKSIIGTPEFIAPEMYDECYDESVDVYAFGMCMIEMATGEYPYSECNTPAQIYKKVTSGTPPQCYQRIDNPELKEIIGRCITHKKEERPTVKELLQMEFFQEDTGFKIELVDKEKFANNLDPKIELRLIVTDAKKRKDKYKENEAIQFAFLIDKDNPDEVSMALVKNGYLTDEDVRTVASLIRSQIQCLKKEREKLIPPAMQVDPNVQSMCQQSQQQTSTAQQTSTNQQQQNAIHQQQQLVHPTPQFNQQAPTNLTQSLADQQQTATNTNQKQVGQECCSSNQETPQQASHSQNTEQTNDQYHSDVNKLNNISKMSPLIMPLANNAINGNLTQQQNDNDNQIVSNQTGTVPSSPDCLSPGSPVRQATLVNTYPLNLQNKFENSSITDLPSATNHQAPTQTTQMVNNTACQQANNQISQSAQQQQQQLNHIVDTTNSALNQVQNQLPQSYTSPDTPTVNQQQNFMNNKLTADQVSNNLEQLSNSTNSTNSTIGNAQSTTSTNSNLPSQVPPVNQSSNAFPAKAMQTNLENLKQAEKKLSSSISSNDLKVNIEQGLQAIFASSSCAQNTNPVASIANSTTTNNGQSTPVLNSTAAAQPSLIKIQPQPCNNYSVENQQSKQLHQPVMNNGNFCAAQNVESNQLMNHHHQQQSNHTTTLSNNQSESTPDLNGQHGSTNLVNAIANSTPVLNDREHLTSNQICSNQPKETNDVKVMKQSINGDGNELCQSVGDRLKKRRFTIIPVEDDLHTSPEHSATNHINGQHLNNNPNNQTETANHQHTNNSCSNSNTISSTSSLSKASSTEEESSSLSGYSTPADSISQIRSRFQVTPIEESTAIDHHETDEKESSSNNKFITRANVVQQLIDAIRSNDSRLKERIIRFICLNYEKVSKQTEFRMLDKCVLFEIMDEMASSYKINSIRKFANTCTNTELGEDSNDLTV